MASCCVSAPLSNTCSAATSAAHRPNRQRKGVTSALGAFGQRRSVTSVALLQRASPSGVVCMAPEEERITRRSPLDFPIEWERPKPGRRPDIFPQFSPMKTPLPPPLPADPPEEEEEEEEKKEEEEDPEKEEKPDNPEKQ